jgi:hypothetical protein
MRPVIETSRPSEHQTFFSKVPAIYDSFGHDASVYPEILILAKKFAVGPPPSARAASHYEKGEQR